MSRTRTFSFHAPRRVLVLIAIASLAAACGGGGGGSAGAVAGAAAGAAAGASGGSSAAGAVAAGAADPGAGGGGTGGIPGTEAFQQTVYPLTRQYCVTCHAGAGPGFPHIAHPDLQTAYRQVVDNQKISLQNAGNSRLVLRLIGGHFCWSVDCMADAAEMQRAIEMWASLEAGTVAGGAADPGGNAGAGAGAGDPTPAMAGISSGALLLSDGVQGESGRFDSFVIARWEFETGMGETAFDTSGVAPAMNLALEGTDWIPGGGIEVVTGKASAPPETSRKLYDRIARPGATQQYTVEAWIVTAALDQTGPARIVSYSQDTGNRNFTFGQQAGRYSFRNRSTALDITPNGTPDLRTADGAVQQALQHVTLTFDALSGRRIYLNGLYTGDADEQGAGALQNWASNYSFQLGNERTNNRLWKGQMMFVAIHDRALSPAQVLQNFQAGVADRFLLRFPLDAWTGPGSFIEFEASEFDAYSYLFCDPLLQAGVNVPVEGIRIAVNGQVPIMSQSFRNVNEIATLSPYDLSDLCSVVPKDLGAARDSFAIVFERLGSAADPFVEPPPPAPGVPEPGEALPDFGLRDFERINQTMAALTGVSPTSNAVQGSFDELSTQLPSTTDVRAFVSAHQVAIAKLAIEYCDAMVDTGALRTAFFGNAFEFGSPVVVAFSTPTKRALIVDALLDQMVGVNLATQPDRLVLEGILNGLTDALTQGCDATNCDATRTRSVVKGMCAAVLGSAAVHLQ